MLKSINQPWAISEKYSNRYGTTWTNLDFVFEEKISAENFKTDPMNCTMGTLTVAGQTIKMRYKDLITYTKAIETYTNNMYASKPKKDEKDKKVKYGISIDRYLFDKMKNEDISVSKFVQNLVKEYYERKEKM